MSEPPLKRPGLVVELKYSDDWLDVLHKRLNEAQITDRKSALVTDQMGVEVRPFDSTVFHLDSDRFPLRVFHLEKWSVPGSRSERTKSKDTSDSSGEGSISPGTTSTRKAGQQVSAELQFEDVWPGILQIKLRAVAGHVVDDDLRGLVATDKTGVEIDLSHHKRVPDEARFPLKLHFRARGATTRQNLEECFDGCTSQTSQNSSFREERGFERGDKVGMLDSENKEFRDHSTDLRYESVLPDVVNNRLREMGSTVNAHQRWCILVTDRIGVQVSMDGGIPEQTRFPLKLHVDETATSPGRDRGVTGMGMRPTLTSIGHKSSRLLKRGLSRLTVSYSGPLSH